MLSRLDTLDSLDEVKGALADLKGYEVKIIDQDEFWSAPVRGKAWELAVAEGALYVSTDKGEISCYVSAREGASENEIIHDPARDFRAAITEQEKKAGSTLVARIR